MQTAESLKRTIKSATDLLSVVKTMKALAAVSIRQYQKAVESLTDYSKTVEMGIQIALKNREEIIGEAPPVDVSRVGIIVFGSDQGLCGQLNEHIATYAVQATHEIGIKKENCHIITVGQRLDAFIEDSGYHIIESLTTPGSVAGITPMVQEIIMILEEWRFKLQIEHVLLFYNKYLIGASYQPHKLHLLPIDREWLKNLELKKWTSNTLPVFSIDWKTLFLCLIREYLFVHVYHAFAESLASENASRLSAMQNAEKNIEERLQELQAHFHRQRQMTITEELLDIVSGFEALK